MAEAHTVEVFCRCDDIEHCDMERYVSDVRILVAELEAMKGGRANDFGSDMALQGESWIRP